MILVRETQKRLPAKNGPTLPQKARKDGPPKTLSDLRVCHPPTQRLSEFKGEPPAEGGAPGYFKPAPPVPPKGFGI